MFNDYVDEGSNISVSVGDYFSSMLDQSMDWEDAALLREKWGGKFCLKGIMSQGDARKAVQIGADGIMVSNHGGRQLDGSRAPFDQISEIADAVGDEIDIILDGGIRRGTHVLKAMPPVLKLARVAECTCTHWRLQDRQGSKLPFKI